MCPCPTISTQFVTALGAFVSTLTHGTIPPSVAPHLCGAILIPLHKKSGGLRPIAVGEVLRRLVSKCVSLSVIAEASRGLSPLQVGVGIPFSCEAIIHSVNSLLIDSSLPPDRKWVLQVDFSNAFNSVDRASMFNEVRSRVPSMAAWIESCYSSQPHLYLGDQSINSCSGVQQGDPLGPLCFALALHPIVERIAEEVPGLVVNVWYLDDGTLCGSSDDLLKALNIIEEDGPARGLCLDQSKSSLFVPCEADLRVSSLPSDIPVASGGCVLLGAPIGSTDFIAAEACKRVAKIKAGLDLLPTLNDSQMEFALLRSCLSLPKFVFILRTCRPDAIG